MNKDKPVIEIAYATANRQWIIEAGAGETILETIRVSQISKDIPDLINQLQTNQLKVGIFSNIVSLNYQPKLNDRIEIYRPLLVDPKVSRLNRIR